MEPAICKIRFTNSCQTGATCLDTSGPSLNILIKLMAVESLVLAPFFLAHTKDGLLFQFFKH